MVVFYNLQTSKELSFVFVFKHKSVCIIRPESKSWPNRRIMIVEYGKATFKEMENH